MNESLQEILSNPQTGPTPTTWLDLIMFLLLVGVMIYLMNKWNTDWHDKVKRSKMLNGMKRFGGKN